MKLDQAATISAGIIIFGAIWFQATLADKVEANTIGRIEDDKKIDSMHDDLLIIKERVTQVWRDNGHKE